jgi:hypothetical protein
MGLPQEREGDENEDDAETGALIDLLSLLGFPIEQKKWEEPENPTKQEDVIGVRWHTGNCSP